MQGAFSHAKVKGAGPAVAMTARGIHVNNETGELAGIQEQLGGKYLLGQLIGRGAMGRVFAGTERSTGDSVAIKVLRPELLSDPDAVARFMQERQILVAIRSPAIVRIIDLVAEGETLAIVMELISGRDLRRYLAARGTLPPAEAVGLTVQLLTGLAAVHAAGVVHRDIKPENLLLDTAPSHATDGAVTLKVTDFGVARLSYGASLTKLSSLIGTPEYMAPELAEGGSAGPAADVYSAGIVLYEMLSGRTPFAGGPVMTVLRRHADKAPPPVPGLAPALWGQLSRMLAKDPADRPENAADAAAALGALATELAPLPALPPMEAPASYQQATTGGSAPAAVPVDGALTVMRHRDRGAPPAPPAPVRPARRPAPRWRLAALLAGAAAVVIAAAAFAVPSLLHRHGPVPPGPTTTADALGVTQAAATTTLSGGGTSSAASPTQSASATASGQQSTAPNGGVVVPASVPVTTSAPVVTASAPAATTQSSAPVQPAPGPATTTQAPVTESYAQVDLSTGGQPWNAVAYFGKLSAIVNAVSGQVTFGSPTSAASDPSVCAETVIFTQVGGSKAVAGAMGLGSGWLAAEPPPSSTTLNGVVHQQLVVPPAGLADGTSFNAAATLSEPQVLKTTSTFSLSLQGSTGSVQTWLVAGQPVSCDG